MKATSGLPALRRAQRGFSLIELMIALVLSLLVMGAALVLFRTNQVTYQANEGQNRIQENARVAFELMSRDIRAAAGSACSNAATVDSSGGYSDTYLNSPVTGTASEFTVTSGDDAAYRITSTTTTSATFDSATVPDATQLFRVNDWVLLCNQRKIYIVQATAVTATTLSFSALPYDMDDDPQGVGGPNAVMLARLRNVRWFVGANGRGGNSLFVSRFGAAAEEVAEGVSNLTVQYLDTPTGPYKNASVDWRNVTAIRIGMTLTGRDVDGRALTRNAPSVVSLRSRTL